MGASSILELQVQCGAIGLLARPQDTDCPGAWSHLVKLQRGDGESKMGKSMPKITAQHPPKVLAERRKLR